MLRENNLTSLIIMETPKDADISNSEGGEGYLSDGIIEFGSIERQHDIVVYMQVIKMKATSHSRKKNLIEIGEYGLSVLGPVFE